ncbi:hypothetical protein HPB50_026885 [Hyalomma asiaticum]|uniref:Uncharacterized protein n=1 Tax=Hyalomma asiaticum TaxID=266040 RepID=A0ACB7RWV2_HYAAI|nr:hypothetical protein HPB50_026885 [Hyalomma asiaticum]
MAKSVPRFPSPTSSWLGAFSTASDAGDSFLDWRERYLDSVTAQRYAKRLRRSGGGSSSSRLGPFLSYDLSRADDDSARTRPTWGVRATTFYLRLCRHVGAMKFRTHEVRSAFL